MGPLGRRDGRRPAEEAAEFVLGLMTGEAAALNGRFLWIEGGLQPRLSSWDEPPG